MNITKLILHYNTPVETENLCVMVPDAIIVNNGSKDTFPKNKSITFTDNLGFVKNWNRILKFMLKCSPSSDAFWLFNSDIEISQYNIERMQILMDTGLYQMITPSFNCWMKQCRNQGTDGVREVKFIEFTAPIIRRDVFEQIGLFDERFSLGYGVDFDFCLRMQYAGIKMYCDDGSCFNHLGQRSITQITGYKKNANAEMITGMTAKYGPSWTSLLGKLK